MTDDELIAEMHQLLTEYVTYFPAFRTKPVGSPGTEARLQQEADIKREDRARKVLSLRPGFSLDAGG